MLDDPVVQVRLAGILGMVGAAMYAAGDVLLLAVRIEPSAHPRLAPHTKLLAGSERMAGLDVRRIAPGGLLGVFGTPFVVLGWWVMFRGLEPAGPVASAPPAALFAAASIIGAFVHGWFMAIADDVRLLDRVDGPASELVLEVVRRHRRILIGSYAPLAAFIVVASAWYSVAVLAGGTAFPTWLAALNPVVLLILLVVVRRLLPARIGDRFEGSAISLAYLVFFALTTATLWNGVG
jgi:hypothetical protein